MLIELFLLFRNRARDSDKHSGKHQYLNHLMSNGEIKYQKCLIVVIGQMRDAKLIFHVMRDSSRHITLSLACEIAIIRWSQIEIRYINIYSSQWR